MPGQGNSYNLRSFGLYKMQPETPILAKDAKLIIDDVVNTIIGYKELVSGIIVPVKKGQIITHNGAEVTLKDVGPDGRIAYTDSSDPDSWLWEDPSVLGFMTALEVQLNGVAVGSRQTVNLLDSPAVTFTVTDNAGNDSIDIEATAIVNRVLLGYSRTTTASPNNTSTNIIHEITIPAGTLGANDSIDVIFEYSASGNVGQKTFEVRYGATSGTLGTLYLSTGGVAASNNSGRYLQRITCKNNVAAQEGTRILGGYGTTTASIITSAIDTTADSYIQICIDKITAADTVSINNFEVWQNIIT